jgi:hypothetical protein
MQKQKQTTRTELQELQDASLVLNPSVESFNTTSLTTPITNRENSMFCPHWRSGYNSKEDSFDGSMSAINRVFVLSYDGKPLTPCKPNKAKKLLKGGVAKAVWNKFGDFGIQMQVKTREFTPKVVLGADFGSKFEGYSLISGSENLHNVMLLLPDKKKLVGKLEERKHLRRARRWRNCRRRECRSDNRNRNGFIAPSQMQIINSRLKIINEFFKCYPVSKVAIEDVKFNHRDKRWGEHFSTAEIGKKHIFDYIRKVVGAEGLILFEGYNTQEFRGKLGLKKSSNKSAEIFSSHCVDSFAIACAISEAKPNFNIKIVDDTYHPIRRRLHDTQPAKKGIRAKYSTGNFKGIRKGTICELGQIVGGTGNRLKILPIIQREETEKRISKSFDKVHWLSHQLNIRGSQFPYRTSSVVPLR